MRFLTLSCAALLLAVASRPALGTDLTGGGAQHCWVTFYSQTNGQGQQITRQGPEQVARIRGIEYANGQSLRRRVRSVSVGPGAWLELFDRKRFRRTLNRIGPGQKGNLERRIADSYRITCQRPSHW